MTAFEAFNQLEQEALALGVLDAQGNQIPDAMVVLGLISKSFGQEWEDLAKAMEEGKCTPDEYYAGISSMIRSFGTMWNQDRIEKKLLELYQHQGHFPLRVQGDLGV